MSERGRWYEDAQGLKVLVTLHPSALLRGDPAEYAGVYKTRLAGWLADVALASKVLASIGVG